MPVILFPFDRPEVGPIGTDRPKFEILEEKHKSRWTPFGSFRASRSTFALIRTSYVTLPEKDTLKLGMAQEEEACFARMEARP